MKNISLGILDLGFRESKDSLSAIQDIIDYAVKADELNFSRFWLAEHHNPNRVAPFTSPDLLIGLIAGMTATIRIGSAGTLVRIHSAYETATNYKFMNNVFNNRVDLGLAKGKPASSKFEEQEYNSSYDAKISEIYDLLNNEEENYLKRELVIPPFGGLAPQTWYLSNSYHHFDQAITYKFNFCRSILHGTGLIDKNHNKEELLVYKDKFFAVNGFYPEVALSMGIVIGETMQDALVKYSSLIVNNPQASTSLEAIPTTIERLYEMLLNYQDSYGIDEFILYDMEGNNANKINNLNEISNVFNLITQ